MCLGVIVIFDHILSILVGNCRVITEFSSTEMAEGVTAVDVLKHVGLLSDVVVISTGNHMSSLPTLDEKVASADVEFRCGRRCLLQMCQHGLGLHPSLGMLGPHQFSTGDALILK